MKILAIDSSGLVASVAIMQDSILLAEYTINYKKTHSQTLLPMLEELKQMLELDLSSIDFIAIAAGPGSFTGLRIGSATAKGLGLALQKPLIEVPTLEGLSYNMYGCDGYICPIMDARRNQVYTAIYQFEQDTTREVEGMDAQIEQTWTQQATSHQMEVNSVLEQGFQRKTIMNQCASDIDELIDYCNKMAKKVIFLGDGVPVYQEKIRERMQVPFSFAPAHRNRQSAASIAALGMQYAMEGKIVTAMEHGPEYLRMSQAERERLGQE